MTVSSEVSSVSYNGNGATQIFAVPFYFLADSHLRVILRAADGTETVQTITTNYTVSGAGNPAGGSITMLVAPATGVAVVVVRNVPATQETDYVANDPFPAESHERALDKLTMLIQQAGYDISRAIRVPDSDPEPSLLSPAQDRANKLFTFDANGNPSTENYNPGDAAGLSVLLADNVNPSNGAALVGYMGRTVYDRLRDMPTFKDYGAKLDGVTDDTAAINAALAANAGGAVYFPKGTALVSDVITIPADTSIYGAGILASNFIIPQTFNLAAAGVLSLAAGGQSTVLEGFGFSFSQPATAVRANLIQYPYAINHNNVARVRINNIRIRAAWNGINASNNAGGADYGFIECGAFNVGLYIDGSLDTFNVGHFKFWPFGIVGQVSEPIFYDGTTRAVSIGRCDGMSGEIHSFRAVCHFIAGANSSAARGLQAIHLDGDGARLIVESGMLDVDYVYNTKSSATGLGPAIHVLNEATTRVRIANIDLTSDEATADCIRVDAGTLAINGGRIRRLGTARRAMYLTGGGLHLRNIEMVAEGTRTVAYIIADAGNLVVQDCYWTANGGTGNAINVTASGVTGRISNNTLSGRTLNIAIGAMYGSVDQKFSGTFSADATTLAYLPAGWTVTKFATGKYRITHNLNWNVNRTFFSFAGQVSTPTNAVSYVIDSATATANQIEVWVYVGATLTDVGTRFEVNFT